MYHIFEVSIDDWRKCWAEKPYWGPKKCWNGSYILVEKQNLHKFFVLTLFSKTKHRWCNRECKRHHLELCQENKRCVLGDEILFSVRYLVMTDEDYYCGPIQGSLLSNNEKNILLGYLRNYKAVTNTSSTLTDSRLAKFRQRRVLPNTKRILLGQK